MFCGDCVNMVKLTFLLLFFCVLLVNSKKYDYAPHVTAVLKYLNSNPNKIYEYKKGTLLNALRNKADIIELSVEVNVICILNSQYEGVPCTEQQQICNGFVQENENEYKVLSDITCKLKGDTSTEIVEDLTTVLPFTEPFIEQDTNIELSHEAVSSEQNADFVAVKADKVPCLGCPFDLNPNVEGVSTLVDTALRHVETERTQRHATIKVIRLQQQVVAGIKYVLIFEIAPTICQKDVDLSSNKCPIDHNSSTSICEVIFLQQPWINKLKHIIKNNCTISQEYNIDMDHQGGSSNDNNIKVDAFGGSNPNSGSGNGKIDDISPDALIDLESQILPLEHEKNKQIKENNSDLGVKSPTGSMEKNTSDDKQTDSINKYNADNGFQESSTIVPSINNSPSNILPSQSTENVNNAYYNGDGKILVNYSEEDVDHNEVRRSIDEVEEIKQDETFLSKDEVDFAISAFEDRDHKKYRRDVLVGAPTDIDVNNSKVLQFTNNALTKLDSISEHPNRYKVLEIISATSQVVAGIKYSIKAKISLSDCLKNESKLLRDCGFLQNEKTKLCDIIVWDQPWLHKSQTTLKCDDNKEYTFEDSSTKSKRSADSKYSEIIQNIETKTNPKVLEYIKTGLQHLNSKSDYETSYVVKKIVKISKQLVSGQLWQIMAEIGLSNCPKLHYIEQCQNMEIKESKLCQFNVWEQPWLRDIPKVNILCENDTNTYFLPVNQQHSGKFDDVVVSMFQDFMVKHNKSYLNEIDFNFRLKVFNDNLKTIKLLNKYEQGTATYGVTQFSDLTRMEFSKSHGLRLDLHNENYIPFTTAVIPNVKLPTEFDWRTKGAVTKVKNQGSCGSCWAFSTIGNIEGQYAIKYGKLVEFSEQELVDCDKLDEGCNGGLMDNAYRSIEEIGGLESESDYPYDGADEKCHFSKAEVKVQIAGALNISHNETDMAKWLVKNGPIAIAINANAMQFYVGGVSHPWSMLCNPKSLDHGVLIVGYGVHYYPLFKKTLPYWIVKNSWGPSWGEQGYYRVYRGDGTCGLNQTPSSSIVA